MAQPSPLTSSPPAHRTAIATARQQKNDAQPWTAARCQRLLRQLQCRLATLRKFKNEVQNPASDRRLKRASLDNSQLPSKRTRHTYSQRHRPASRSAISEMSPNSISKTATSPSKPVRTLGAMKPGQCSPEPGRVEFTTPVLRKIYDQSNTPCSSLPASESATTVPRALLEDLQRLRRSAPDRHFRIYEAIFDWLGNLLRSTESRSQAPHPKSLLGMCLRRVPTTIADIEAWDRKMSEKEGTRSVWGTSNASTELYTQLEGFGVTGLGWKPLKLVVRAHALSILVEAVTEGLFETPFVRLLVELCLHLKCKEEAASIVIHLKGRLAFPQSSSSTPSENSRLQPVGAIVDTLHGRNSPGASFDCLSKLIRSKTLPLGWLSTRGFRSTWTSGLKVIMAGKLAPSALGFMCTGLKHLAVKDGKEKWSQESGREQTLTSMAAVLAATAAGFGSEIGISPNAHQTRARRRLIYALDECISEARVHGRAARDGGLFILSLARYLATAEDEIAHAAAAPQADADCRDLIALKGSQANVQYRQALLLICSIAQYRGRAGGVPCHDILSKVCSAMDRLALPEWFRVGLRTDGAFVLAQKTKDLRDLAFAERLPAVASAASQTKTVFSGWRWEEGISEWVVPSPGRQTDGRLRSTEVSGDVAGHGGRERRAVGGNLQRDPDNENSNQETGSDETPRDDDDDVSLSSGDELVRNKTPIRCRRQARKALVSKGPDFDGSAAKASARPSAFQGVVPSKRSPRGSTGSSFASQGPALKQLRNARGLSQIRCLGATLDDDDWDELI